MSSVIRNRILFLLLPGLFVGVLIWWVLYVPYAPDSVSRAIPGNALFVSVHDDIDTRWDGLLQSPLTRAIAYRLGMDSAALDQLAQSANSSWWVRHLAGSRTVLGYVPSLGDTGSPAWVLAGWCGNHSRLLPWAASCKTIPSLVPAGTYGARPIWNIAMPSLPSNRILSVTVGEGVFMACLSPYRQGVRYMLDSYDGIPHARSILSVQDTAEISVLRTNTWPDRGWMWGSVPFSYAISQHTDRSVTGCLWRRHRTRRALDLRNSAHLRTLGRLLGDLPEMLCILPTGSITDDFLARLHFHAWPAIAADTLRKAVSDGEEKPVFACLLGGEYRGRLKSVLPSEYNGLLKGFAVPTFIAGIAVDDTDRAATLATEMLDRINAELWWGIIPRVIPVGDEMVFALEGTGNDPYSRFRIEERVAYAICGGWFLISSNMEALARIVARFQREEAKSEAMSGRWLRDIEKKDSLGYLWCDIAAAGDTLADGIALLRYVLAAMDDEALTTGQRNTLDVVCAWIKAARFLGTCSINAMSAEPSNSHVERAWALSRLEFQTRQTE